MKLVKQKGFGGCGIACLAMVTGKAYGFIEDFFPEAKTRGTTPHEIITVLKYYDYKNPREIFGPPIDTKRPTIISVPSLNYPGLLHFIVWDGEKYYDPAVGGKLYPNDAYIVNGKSQICCGSSIVWDMPVVSEDKYAQLLFRLALVAEKYRHLPNNFHITYEDACELDQCIIAVRDMVFPVPTTSPPVKT